MTLSIAVGTLVFTVCLVLVGCIATLIKVQQVHQQCISILCCVYDWLEKIHSKQEQSEVTAHEGTD